LSNIEKYWEILRNIEKHWETLRNIEKHWATLSNIETLKTLSSFSIYWISNIEFNSMSMWKIKTLKRYSMSMSMSIFSIFQCETQCSMSICRPLVYCDQGRSKAKSPSRPLIIFAPLQKNLNTQKRKLWSNIVEFNIIMSNLTSNLVLNAIFRPKPAYLVSNGQSWLNFTKFKVKFCRILSFWKSNLVKFDQSQKVEFEFKTWNSNEFKWIRPI